MDKVQLAPEQIEFLFPVSEARVFDGLIIFKRQARFTQLKPLKKHEVSKRGRIAMMSAKSKLRIAEIAATTATEFHSIMTLTYPVQFPLDGKEAKRHLNNFLTQFRKLHDDFRYIWFLEFQKRGAPHWHIISTIKSPMTSSIKRCELAEVWSRIVAPDVEYSDMKTKSVRSLRLQTYKSHRHRLTWEPIREPNGVVKYLVKYALKPWQKEVPEQYRNVGRYWGASRSVKDNLKEHHVIEIDQEDAIKMTQDKRPGLYEQLHMVPKMLFVPYLDKTETKAEQNA